MKWRVRKPGARKRAKRLWHRWFAWRPVRVPTNGKRSGMTMVWLQFVMRKERYRYLYWKPLHRQRFIYVGDIYKFIDEE